MPQATSTRRKFLASAAAATVAAVLGVNFRRVLGRIWTS